MKCEKLKKLLPDYSVGALSEKKRELVKRHIDSCPECMRELGYLDETASLLDSIPQEEPPDFLWEGVRRGIVQQEHLLETLGIEAPVYLAEHYGLAMGETHPRFGNGFSSFDTGSGFIFCPMGIYDGIRIYTLC